MSEMFHGEIMFDGMMDGVSEERSENLYVPKAQYEDKVAELSATVERLRSALILTGRNLGGALADGVSNEFLEHVPEEAKLKIAALEAELATAIKTVDRLRDALREAKPAAKEEK